MMEHEFPKFSHIEYGDHITIFPYLCQKCGSLDNGTTYCPAKHKKKSPADQARLGDRDMITAWKHQKAAHEYQMQNDPVYRKQNEIVRKQREALKRNALKR